MALNLETVAMKLLRSLVRESLLQAGMEEREVEEVERAQARMAKLAYEHGKRDATNLEREG